jgi:hypothetical protein
MRVDGELIEGSVKDEWIIYIRRPPLKLNSSLAIRADQGEAQEVLR